MTTAPRCPIELDELLSYLLDGGRVGVDGHGDSAGDDPGSERLEDHLFDCAACARELESLERLREVLSDGVRAGAVGGAVGAAFLERAARDGVSMREYRIPAGGTVTCVAGPEDLVVVRLETAGETLSDLHLDGVFRDLEGRDESPLPTREVVADRQLQAVVLVVPGALVRSYPRSRWTLHLRGEGADGPRELGPFVMDHHP